MQLHLRSKETLKMAGFQTVDLDSILDEFEFNQNEAERQQKHEIADTHDGEIASSCSQSQPSELNPVNR